MKFSAALLATVAVMASTAVQATLTSAQVACLQAQGCSKDPTSCLAKCFNVSTEQVESVSNCFADCDGDSHGADCDKGCTDKAEQVLGTNLNDINSVLYDTPAVSGSASSVESATATASKSKSASASATSSSQSSRATSVSSSASSVSTQSKSASVTKSATASNTLDSPDDSDSAAPSLSVAAATLFSLSAAAALAVLY
ncbi:hypothetical protein IWQ60_004127 [Tieghemiomyces parasiticus]|uniref:Extracellular membrane protein CFEM domain-containing protein n=1 Tax=Tieghemiomyces parasiticus TaxID=78921 RepID=A0A9W8AGD6_9FUNG|nr:hypothetical protein IWQ60_004127 [Tieghemiomyces parasiticus]